MHRYEPGPGMPALPPQLSDLGSTNIDQYAQQLKRLPFFMTSLDGDDHTNELEALRALSYDGDPDEVAANFKKQGNDCYRFKDYGNAVEYYTKALAVEVKDQALKTACLSNRAACNLELQNYRRCITDCKLVLQTDPGHVKCLFRAARAYFALDKVDEATDLLEYAVTVAPQDAAIKSLLDKSRLRKVALVQIEAARVERQRTTETISNNLESALQSRGVLMLRTRGVTDQKIAEKIHLQTPLDISSPLLLHVLVLYPLVLESDVIEDEPESTTVGAVVDMVLGSPPQWAQSTNEYRPESVTVFAQTQAGGLAKIGRKLDLAKVLAMAAPKIPVIDGSLRLYVVPTALREVYAKSWNRAGALELLEPYN